jgi:hypothetical protein
MVAMRTLRGGREKRGSRGEGKGEEDDVRNSSQEVKRRKRQKGGEAHSCPGQSTISKQVDSSAMSREALKGHTDERNVPDELHPRLATRSLAWRPVLL